MTQKEARKIMLWSAIEQYRTAGGREEHHAYKEALDNYIDDMLNEIAALRERINALGEWADVCVQQELGGDICAGCRCGKSDKSNAMNSEKESMK